MANPRALIVDDEPDLCELLSLTLARMGVDSSAVHDLASARRELQSRQDYALCLTDLRLPDGERWSFKAEGGVLSIEESTFFANSTGPRESLQIVVRGVTYGESEINWVVERALEEQTE